MHLFRQRLLWAKIAAVFAVVALFGLAMMGSVLGATPKDLPVALVVLDRGAELPDGGRLAAGETIRSKLQETKGIPLKWHVLQSEADARRGIDHRDYYGALIIPADFSAGLLSLQTANPKPATVTILINEGMNAQAAAAVRQMLGQMMIRTASAMLTPFMLREETAHPVGANNASGNAPNMLTQLLWIGSLVASIFLFLAARKERHDGSAPWAAVLAQTAAGLLLAGLVSAFLLWTASSWYGMELHNGMKAWLFLWLAGSAFFLLQISLLNWLDLPAVGLLVLLFFFSMPVINLPPEFLPEATRLGVYVWTPFRFVSEGLRDILYFGGTDRLTDSYAVLGWLAGVCLVLAAASVFRTSVFRKA
ncbi:MAG: DUF3533 domain-containing protein [Candidatus Reconcilbacillus cellulovorans]|uniref:DUF3533 domain-containing protein n=1 Tax=Candidatus Reconcilbacillus cellulovorans TaxID=1906605 RepID=A0A2A6E3E0_9BACL|nr:MAG: DUF3533 domain-containing protein [Candidatus Reconcilbacillus cellulovorans]